MLDYRQKTQLEIPTIKSTRGWYQVIQNPNTKQYHLRRLATNGQILWRTEEYVNRSDIDTILNYPGFDGNKDLLITA
ncbi:MAG: hypothetical protein WC872_04365 [Candidatus Absconditabacterales bacterium]